MDAKIICFMASLFCALEIPSVDAALITYDEASLLSHKGSTEKA